MLPTSTHNVLSGSHLTQKYSQNTWYYIYDGRLSTWEQTTQNKARQDRHKTCVRGRATRQGTLHCCTTRRTIEKGKKTARGKSASYSNSKKHAVTFSYAPIAAAFGSTTSNATVRRTDTIANTFPVVKASSGADQRMGSESRSGTKKKKKKKSRCQRKTKRKNHGKEEAGVG